MKRSVARLLVSLVASAAPAEELWIRDVRCTKEPYEDVFAITCEPSSSTTR